MNRLLRFTFGVLLACLLVSCDTPASSPPTATMPQPTGKVVGVEVTQEPSHFPLSEPGPYYAGKRTFTFADASRGGREVGITVLYPALLPEGSQGTKLLAGTNRDPDLSGAPYP